MSREQIVVLCTTPDRETADRIARVLVEEKLAACVNIVPGLTSVYEWKGRIETDAELLLVIKTRTGRSEELEARVRGLHPDEVPEIIELPVTGGSKPYLDWMIEETTA